MIQLYQKISSLRILAAFFDNPREGYYIREMARMTGLSAMTAKRSFDELEEQGLITRERTKGRTLFKGNSESPTFRQMKISYTVSEIEASGLMGHLQGSMQGITSLVLYGSAARGEDGPGSDLDLLVVSMSRGGPDLRKFERSIGRSVSLKVFTPTDWDKQVRKNKAFYTDVITEGIVLFGRRPVVA